MSCRDKEKKMQIKIYIRYFECIACDFTVYCPLSFIVVYCLLGKNGLDFANKIDTGLMSS